MLGSICAISNDFVSSKLIQLSLLMLMVYLVGYICALLMIVCGGGGGLKKEKKKRIFWFFINEEY